MRVRDRESNQEPRAEKIYLFFLLLFFLRLISLYSVAVFFSLSLHLLLLLLTVLYFASPFFSHSQWIRQKKTNRISTSAAMCVQNAQPLGYFIQWDSFLAQCLLWLQTSFSPTTNLSVNIHTHTSTIAAHWLIGKIFHRDLIPFFLLRSFLIFWTENFPVAFPHFIPFDFFFRFVFSFLSSTTKIKYFSLLHTNTEEEEEQCFF